MIDRRIKIRHIQTFVEIVRLGSMKDAGARLGLTQPAISKTLKELEEAVGAPLLTRSRAGISMTAEGRALVRFAEMSLAALQQGLDGAGRVARGERGVLSIGALPSVAVRLMPNVVRNLATLTPNVDLRIEDGPHRYLIERLRSGDLGAVIGRMGSPATMQGLSFTQLYNERVDFVVRPGHPILADPDIRSIGRWEVLYPTEAAAIRPVVERFLISQGVADLPTRIETVSGAFGRSYVPISDAVWIISSGVVSTEIAAGRLVALPFDTTITAGPIGLITRPSDAATSEECLLRIALDEAVEELGLV